MTGNHEFAILWKANHQNVYTGLRKCGATHADAEDALSQATIRAWQARDRFDALKGSFRTWLGCISFRCWLRILHKRKRYVPLDDESLYPDESSYPGPFLEFDELGPDELTLTELARILTETIQDRESAIANQGQQPAESYPMITAELVQRARAGGRVRQADIARALGIDPSTVCRCFRYLREQLPELKPP